MMGHLQDWSSLQDPTGRASSLGRPNPVSYPASYSQASCLLFYVVYIVWCHVFVYLVLLMYSYSRLVSIYSCCCHVRIVSVDNWFHICALTYTYMYSILALLMSSWGCGQLDTRSTHVSSWLIYQKVNSTQESTRHTVNSTHEWNQRVNFKAV